MKRIASLAVPPLLLVACSGPAPQANRPKPPAPARSVADVDTAALLDETAELHRQGRFEEGVVRLEEEIARDPARPRLHYNLGIFRAALGNFEGAAEALEEELSRFGDHPETHRALATAYTRVGRLEDSIPHFESCLATEPDDAVCVFGLGQNLSVLGLLDDAVVQLERAAELRRDAAAWAELGIVHRRRGELRKAATAFAEALADQPTHLATLLGYGQTLSAMGREADGEALLEKHRHFSALQDQLDAFERASRQNTPPAEGFLDLARLQLRREDPEAARAAYQRALELDPSSAVAMLELADLHLEKKRWDEAESLAQRAFQIDPTNSAPAFYRGLALLGRGDGKAAAEAFTSSLELGGWPPDALVELGAAYHAAGDLDRAAASYLEAIQQAPNEARAHLGLARVRRERGELVPAGQAAQQALKLDPSHSATWKLYGVLAFEAGDQDSAQKAFERAVSNARLTLLQADGTERLLDDFPDNPAARELFQRLLSTAASG